MSYQFGNIFVQAMENQKRLATQRQQFDQSMSMQRDQMAQQESQFSRGHALDKVRTGYEGERLGIEKGRDTREGERHEADRTTDPDKIMGDYGYKPGAFGEQNFLSHLSPWAGQGLMRMDMDWRQREHQPQGQYWTDREGDRTFVRTGGEVPKGFHTNLGEALEFDNVQRANELIGQIQPRIQNIPLRPQTDNLGAEFKNINSVMRDLRGIDARTLTPEQQRNLGLYDIAHYARYHIERLDQNTGDKKLIRKIGKQKAHKLLNEAHDIMRELGIIGFDTGLSAGAYVPDYKEPTIDFRNLFQTGEGGLLDSAINADEARGRHGIGGRR